MSLINKFISNPVFTLAWIAFVELLLQQGYLTPELRDRWLTDGSMLIAEGGLVILLSTYAHHRFDHHKKQKLAEATKPMDGTITVSTASSTMITSQAKETISYLRKITGLLKGLKYIAIEKPQTPQE